MTPQKVLLVDDEDSLRQLLGKYLTRIGYEVDSAGTAEEGWALYQSSPDSYSLVLVDLTMPPGMMQGDELMMRVLELDNPVRVLLSSGYPVEMGSMPAKYKSRAVFLQKPYLPRQLADLVKRLIGPPPGQANSAE